MGGIPRRTWIGVAVAVGALVIAWLIRPVFHGLVMQFWTKPLMWVGPIIILGFVVVIVRRDYAAWQRAERGPSWTSLAGFGVAFVVVLGISALLTNALVGRSLYTHTDYQEISSLPTGGQPRLLPKEVAVQMATSGFNSPTEQLTEFHITLTPKGQGWTALRTPNGVFRRYTKQSQGLATLDADITARSLNEVDGQFKYAPGQQITDNLRWRLLKKHYLITLAESVGILDAAGKPLIVVPYIKYKGFLVKRPVFGGVFVVHPDGKIEDLSPDEARKRPEIVESGRMFPEKLARQMQDAYAYKNGIANRFFTHREQTQISDTESNEQPYLINFGGGVAKWVTVAEPYGRAYAVNAVFLTDTVSGKTQIWRAPRGQALTGNRRALETVRSVSIPGVVFANTAAGSSTSGRFRTVEPRPVFINGSLRYMISVIPESANSVSKTVFVDAGTNKVVAIFDNDSDEQADAKIRRYLMTGKASGASRGTEPTPRPEEPATTTTSPSAPAATLSDEELQRRIDDLLRRQQELVDETKALSDALGDR